jgi:EpsI family protein
VPVTISAYRLTAAALAAAAFGICYHEVIASIVGVWSTNATYSYGFAVPFIAAYVFWTRWNRCAPHVTADYVLGIPVTLAGIGLLIVGQIGALIAVQQLSLIVTLAGVLLLLFGRDVVRAHWFAIAYLLLMIPLWSMPIAFLQDPSRLLSAAIAANLLDVSGVPVIREGTEIILPSQTLSVLLECSGVNQLIALTAMVVPAAYVWLDTNVRRVALLLFAVTISYLSNGFRIAIVGWLAVNGLGDGDINGSAHLVQGLLVSALAYLAIGGCLTLLSTSESSADQGRDESASASPAIAASPLAGRRVWLDIAVLLVMLGAGAAGLSASQLDVQLNEDLRSLESTIGDWTVEIDPPTMAVQLPSIDDDLVNVGGYPTLTGERRFVAVDDEIVRVYRDSSGRRVRLYVGYYHRQEDGKELTGEAGTDLADAASPLTLTTGSRQLEINEIIHADAGTRRGVVFWYDINGRIVSDFYRLKSYTIWDSMTRRRTNGAVVMIAWDGPEGAESDAARQRAIEFAQALMPVLQRHLPV